MRANRFVMAIAAFVMLPLQAGTSAGEPLEGDWIGGIEHGPDWTYVQAHIRKQGDEYEGSLDAFVVPFDFVQDQKLTGLHVDSSRVRFQARIKSEDWAFDGRLMDAVVTGHVTRASQRMPFRLERVAKVTAADYIGFYETEGGRLVMLHTAFILGPNFLGFLDFTTGRTGGLFPRSPNEFFTGPGVLLTYPDAATVRFTEKNDGKWMGLTWTDSGGAPLHGKRIEFREEEVSFTNGTVTLAGTLVRPPTGQRHPAIVFAPASTAMATREMARPFAQYFAFHGIACLIYDKRGTGSSQGDWLQAGFGELADDALAGVQALKARPEIDARQIGLWGGSQSGWIVALAASRSADVAFLISQSGPGVTPEEQELYRSESFLRADGYGEEDIRKAMALVRQRYQWSRTGEGWDELSATDRAARNEPWYPYIGALGGKENPFWHFWSLIRDYDPMPALEKIRCPVLALFGERDTFVPVEKSVENWERGLKKAGNQDVTIKVFPDADHSLIETKTGGLKELPRLRRFTPGCFEFQREWLLRHVNVNP